MILEAAILSVRPGEAAAFEAAMTKARPLIAASPGFRSIEVRRGIETPDNYLLLVGWDTVADHKAGFRSSARYAEWRALLHHFYDPMPVVEHYGPALG
nr:antibiotic biosynthesis monooxygenase [Polymorphobacter sp.]